MFLRAEGATRRSYRWDFNIRNDLRVARHVGTGLHFQFFIPSVVTGRQGKYFPGEFC